MNKNYVPSEHELRSMDLGEDHKENPCDGCAYEVHGDCGQGLEYGVGGPCFDDGC